MVAVLFEWSPNSKQLNIQETVSMGTSVGNDLPLAPQLVISMATQLVCSALTLKVANTEMTLRFFQVAQPWVQEDLISPCLVWWLKPSVSTKQATLRLSVCMGHAVKLEVSEGKSLLCCLATKRNERSLLECLFPFSLHCLKYTIFLQTLRLLMLFVFVQLLFEGWHFVSLESPQTSMMAC